MVLEEETHKFVFSWYTKSNKYNSIKLIDATHHMQAYDLPDEMKSFLRTLNPTYIQKREEAKLNIDATDADIRNYIGTYFPRSYSEVRSIYQEICKNQTASSKFCPDETARILSLGCGSGPDLLAAIDVIRENCPHVKKIEILAFEGNEYAITYAKRILSKEQQLTKVRLEIAICQFKFDSIQSFSRLRDILLTKNLSFDLIQTSKFCGELLIQHIQKPYYYFASTFSSFLKPNGFILILDVTIKNENGLFYPQILNREISDFERDYPEIKTVLPVPCNCWAVRCTRHCFSGVQLGTGKFCFRLLGRTSMVNSLNIRHENRRYIVDYFGKACFYSERFPQVADAYTFG